MSIHVAERKLMDESLWQRLLRQVREWRWILVSSTGVLAFIAVAYLFKWEWTGFPKRELFDWLDMLIVPAVLALGVYWLNAKQSQREQAAEQQRQDRELKMQERHEQDTALREYLHQMDNLLKEGLRDPLGGKELRASARARTLEMLETLDGYRIRNVLEFLYRAGLMTQTQPLARCSTTTQ
jgi:hypothetical protein